MKTGFLFLTGTIALLAIIHTAAARGPGAAGGSFGSGPPTGGFGYQGPQFGYQGPAFGDSRAAPSYETPGNRGYGTATPQASEHTGPQVRTGPGDKPSTSEDAVSPDSDY